MEAAMVAILCVILGCILGGGFFIGRKMGKLEQCVKNLTNKQEKANKQRENFEEHIKELRDRLIRIEIKLGIKD